MLSDAQKKRLEKEKSKLQLSEMGVLQIKNTDSKKYYIFAAPVIRDSYESILFRLRAGKYILNKELQKDWNALGENRFQFKVLEIVAYDPRYPDTNYVKKVENLVNAHKDRIRLKEQLLY